MNSCDCVSMSNSDKGNNAPSGGSLDVESNHTNGDRLRLVVRLQVAPHLLHGKSTLRADEGQRHVGGRVEEGIREHGARRPGPPSFGRHTVRTTRVVVDVGAEMTGIPIGPRVASGPVARPVALSTQPGRGACRPYLGSGRMVPAHCARYVECLC